MRDQFFISVGGPWNFESLDGANIIKGSILKIVSSTCLIFKANNLLDFDKGTGDLLVLYPRYATDNFDLLARDTDFVVINGNLLAEEYLETADEVYFKKKFIFRDSRKYKKDKLTNRIYVESLAKYSLDRRQVQVI